jgi:hypothetical protein
VDGDFMIRQIEAFSEAHIYICFILMFDFIKIRAAAWNIPQKVSKQTHHSELNKSITNTTSVAMFKASRGILNEDGRKKFCS